MYIENKDFGLHIIVNGPMGNNTYLLVKGEDCVVIDPASKSIADKITKLGLHPKAILLTHGHFDHIKGVAAIKSETCPVYIHEGDNDKCNGKDMGEYLTRFRIEPFDCDRYVTDGEVLHLIGLDIRVIATPGHSKGGVCYVVGDSIFCGDTLFEGSFGRYDFDDGSIDQLKDSIKNKLFTLEGDYKVYPGHGDSTTLNNEREGNPILWI